MCNSPNKLSDGSLVACRKCGQCRSNRIDEWVGRCIAESKTSVATTSLTLTYGRDENGEESHVRAAILTYSDVQKFAKQMRNRGYPFRYLITGEHGSKKGRAHWHGLLFWQEQVPTHLYDYGNNSWFRGKRETAIAVPVEWGKRFNEPCWVHGYSHWQPVRNGHEQGSIAYACKYINKDVDDPHAQSKLAMSKLPPIGSEYFIRRAQKFVDERIAPQDPFYQFPGEARRKNGNIVNFMLRGKIGEIFCEAFVRKWAEQVGGHMPHSDYIEEYLDRKTRKEAGDYQYQGGGRFIRMPSAELLRPERRWPMNPPFGFTDADIEFDYWKNCPRVRVGEGAFKWFYSNEKGMRGWRSEAPKDVAAPQSVESVLKRLEQNRAETMIQLQGQWIEAQEWPEVWPE
ncbi:replication initiator protein [Flyfo microvirus Tbat2_88]|nr:replication initiator protein [Flyfo microvirus Tbat2_88]